MYGDTKGHAYLHKPTAKSWNFVLSIYIFRYQKALKGWNKASHEC